MRTRAAVLSAIDESLNVVGLEERRLGDPQAGEVLVRRVAARMPKTTRVTMDSTVVTRRAPVVRLASALLLLAAFLLLSAGPAHAQTAARKAGRGLAGMTTAFLEVPGNMYREGERDGAGGVAIGFAKGLGLIVPRVLIGVYELVTAPIPAPAGFRPILQPEFPWGYFD